MAEAEFVEMTAQEVAHSPEFVQDKATADPVWVERIGKIAVGAGFKINRPEGETQRAFKKRINRAASATYRILEWKSQDTNLPDGVEATHYVVKVKALDIKAKAAAEAKAAANGTSSETASGGATDNGQSETPDEASSEAGSRQRPHRAS